MCKTKEKMFQTYEDCEKKSYSSPLQAIKEMKKQATKGYKNYNLGYYKCPKCKKYHLTSKLNHK